ncbi:hypothetical protein F5Y17DRAFT_279875 [Xylariaceae sp. FL0594]|nr:hypothetical protein F5Y17DRAFT_279875 [Xylariaceae sp. FL0594]
MACRAANAPIHYFIGARDSTNNCERRSHSHKPLEQLPEPTELPVALSIPLRGAADGDIDGLVYALGEERPEYLFFLERLGFNHETSWAILRYWITLKLKAPAGGPYDLFGTALAVIAELDEPQKRTCHDCINVRQAPGKSCKVDWFLAFARILNDRALASLQSIVLHRPRSFKQAKIIVYRMMLACGGEYWG